MTDTDIIAELEQHEDDLIARERWLLDHGQHEAAATVTRDLERLQRALVALVLGK